ncbi:MAG: hypothetical protein EXS55_01555 [Candidatus Magasanikbacteria bacterium]|nr:hypothetical protein [Candidatus Magasanikbacteria bacterium]
MKKHFFTSLPLFLLVLGAGCATTTPHPPLEHAVYGEGSEHITIASGAVLAGSRVALVKNNNLQPGLVNFKFKLYGMRRQELTADDLKIEHEKKMHFILARNDATNFQHLHPEYLNNSWSVTTTIAVAGQYELYVDIAPVTEPAVVWRVPVLIGGPTANAIPPTPNADHSDVDGDTHAKLVIEEPLMTNKETLLTFVVTKNKQPAIIDPYLGAYGHVVLLRHSHPDDFFHVHPLTEQKPLNGEVQFSALFPSAGRYTIFAQLNIDGVVKTFPITVDVGDSDRPAATESEHMVR